MKNQLVIFICLVFLNVSFCKLIEPIANKNLVENTQNIILINGIRLEPVIYKNPLLLKSHLMNKRKIYDENKKLFQPKFINKFQRSHPVKIYYRKLNEDKRLLNAQIIPKIEKENKFIDFKVFSGMEYENSTMINDFAVNTNFASNILDKISSNGKMNTSKLEKNNTNDDMNLTYSGKKKFDTKEKRGSSKIKKKSKLEKEKNNIIENIKLSKNSSSIKRIKNLNRPRDEERKKLNKIFKESKKTYEQNKMKKKKDVHYKPTIKLPNEKSNKTKSNENYFLYKGHSFTIENCDDGYLGTFVKLLNYQDKECQNKYLKLYLNNKYFSIANDYDTDKYIEIMFLNRIKIDNETFGNCFSVSYEGNRYFLDMCFETQEIAEDVLKSIKFLKLCKNPKKARNFLKQQQKIRKCFLKYKFLKYLHTN